MIDQQSITAFSALAHETRLAIFRLLIKSGTQGLAAGDIGAQLDVKPSTLSANLSVLNHAGLITAQREGRSIIYAADFSVLRAMLAFLMEDCCGGNPAVCQPILDEIACAC